MSDKQNKQPGWIRPSPMRSNPPRLMSPTAQPRQRSPTPTFNARQLTDTPPFSQTQQSPTPPLRRTIPQTPTGFTTVYESQRFSPSHPIPPQQKSIQQQHQNIPMSPINLPPDLTYPRPYHSTFSPAPSASTPCSIPPFSPTPMYTERDHVKSMNDFYVVPLEPANLSRGVTVYDEENENRPSTADIIAQQSQDYVDEKLAEYQATITYLQDEQERVQKKTFVNWINSYLAKRNPPLRIEDLYSDLRDGTKLIALLEILSGERLPVEKGRNMKRPHFLSNANTALQFLASKRIKLVNINSTDLVDGKPAVVLGLIWTIILYFQIEENSRIMNYMENVPSSSRTDGKKQLLSWVSKTIPSELGIEIKDFGPSWRDGYAFMGLINAIDENLIDINKYRDASNKHRLNTSFNVAESELGIPKLLDPDDVDLAKPDERSVMTYVAQFLHKYPEPKPLHASSGESNFQQLQNILQWMREQIIKYDSMNGSYPLDVEMYMQTVTLTNQKYDTFEKIKQSVNTPDNLLIEFKDSKKRLNTLLDEWKKYLDYNLPGELKAIGVWLYQAEKMLIDNDLPDTMNEETAALISKKIETHKKFFAAYPDVLDRFNTIKDNPQYQNISPKIFEYVEKRLLDIEPKARERRIRLKFMEHKCCLIAFLNLLENKISSVRYGNEDVVRHSLDQIRSFLTRNKIVEEFERALVDMRQVIEEYQVDGNLTGKDMYDIDTFMNETENRWKSVSTGLKCTETMLEETLNNWKRYNTTSKDLDSWMDAAENALGFPEMERLEFFKDIALVKKSFESLDDFYNFLKTTCDRETVNALDHDYHMLCQRWDRIYQYAKQYTHAGDILKNRQIYENGIQTLCSWLRNSENILVRQNLNTADQIKQHQEDLKKISGELEEMEDLFRNISKSFQSLIPDISRDEVDRIMKLLKKEKEALVCIRAQIPVKMQLFHQLLSQQESIEMGQNEITQWLDEAENLLSTYSLATRKSQTIAQLEKHKQFFAKTLYYKSMLESKNIVLQNLLRAVDIENNMDTTAAQEKMRTINERFNYVVSNAVQWERKLHEIVACWNAFEITEKQLAEYLKKANHWLTQPLTDNREDLDAQINFFENLNDKYVNSFINAANDLSKYLPTAGKQDVVDIVDKLQVKWNNLISIVPLHLMKIHFYTENIKFTHLIRDIEKELNYEEQAFHRNENLDELLAQHVQFFQQSPVLKTAEVTLSKMHNILTHYNAELPNDKELTTVYQNKSIVWQNLCKRIDIIFNDLQQIPDQWKNYHEKFTKISRWMDNVEESLSRLTKELNSLEEFEREKLIFQNICTEADEKREDMKWLLKTLDYLISHAPEDVVHVEQNKLEDLVARYKILIPTIEITMIKTEVFSKCYTYRQDVSTIVALLEKISNQAASQTAQQPENLNTVKHMIKIQESAINQLDNQRGHIMTMLQRGKDLSKDVHAPAFISDEVKNLETGWNQTYTTTQEKLHTLKNVENIWQQFDNQKREIMNLVNLAETELRSVTPLQTNPANCITDLQNKQQLQVHLQKSAVPIFSKLGQLFEKLVAETPIKEEMFLKDMGDLHKRFNNTLDHLRDRVDYLENYNCKWNDYKKRLADLHAWATQIAPQIIESLKSADLAPEERKERLEKLEVEFNEKMKTFELLSSDAFDLAPKEGNIMEAKKLKNEVRNLHATMSGINNAIQNNAQIINNDLTHWQQYQVQISEIKPWVEDAPQSLSIDDYQPTVINDAKQFCNDIELYKQQCQKKIIKLDEIAKIGEEIQLNDFLPNDIEFYQAKWKKVHENANILGGKMGTLTNNWEYFNDQIAQLEEWIDESNNHLNNIYDNLAECGIDDLEKHLNTMKFFENELSGKHADLVSLNQLSEKLCINLSPEGSAIIKEKLKIVKEQIDGIGKKVKSQVQAIGSKINTNQEINTKLNNFNNWMENLRKNILEIDNVSIRNIEPSLQLIHSLIEQHNERENAFNDIYQDIKKMAIAANPAEATILNDTYSALASGYQNLNNNLYDKKNFLEKWAEFLHWVKDIKEFLRHQGKQMSDISTPPEIEQTSASIVEYLSCLPVWKETASELDSKPIVRIKNDYDKVEYAIPLVNGLETELENLKEKCTAKLSKNKQLNERKIIFKNLERQVIDNLNGFTKDINQINDMVDTKVIQFDEALSKCVDVKNNLVECQPIINQIHQEGNALIKDDFNDMINVQEILLVLDKEYGNLNDISDESIQNFTLLTKASTDHKKLIEKAKNEILSIPFIDEHEILNNQIVKSVLDANVDTVKRQLEQLRKIKMQIDDIDRKGNEMLKFCDNINRQPPDIAEDVQELKNLWNGAHEKVSTQAVLFDNISSLWQQVDDSAIEINNWLDDIDIIISESVENKKEVESGFIRLNKYKVELPSYLNLTKEMENKIDEIKKIQGVTLEPQQIQHTLNIINERFAEIDEKVKGLENIATNFSQDEKDFKMKLKTVNENINKARDKIIECDDTSGEIGKIIENLNKCYVVDKDLDQNKNELTSLSSFLNSLLEKFPNIKESSLPKELENIKRRQDVLVKNNEKNKRNLSGNIEKTIKDKIVNCSKLILQQCEKVKWCNPDAASDKYNLEVKLSSLNDVEKFKNDCLEKLNDIDQSLEKANNLKKVNIPGLVEMKNQLNKNYEQLVKDCNDIKSSLEENISLWNKYETVSELLLNSLKDLEIKTKGETAYQIDLFTIEDKQKNVQEYKKQVEALKPSLKELTNLGTEINSKNQEAHINQVVNQTTARYNMVSNLINTILDRLADYKQKYADYNEANNNFSTWLADTKTQTDNLVKLADSGTSSSKIQLQDLKSLLNQMVARFDELKTLNEKGEVLYTGVTMESREGIRKNLKQLRNVYETTHKKLNSLIKKLDSDISQKTSIEENHEQIKQWLAETSPKVLSSELYATLPEKKTALHANKTLLQDVALHKNLLQQLESKSLNISDKDALVRMKATGKEYDNLLQSIENKIATYEDHINNHEFFDSKIEAFRDELLGLKNDWVETIADTVEPKSIDDNIKFSQTILEKKNALDDKLEQCYQQLNVVMNQTHEKGHPNLFNSFKEQKDDWLKFLAMCEENQLKYTMIKDQCDKFNDVFSELLAFLKEKEAIIKDQNLKNSYETKVNHLSMLKTLLQEIKGKSNSLSKLYEEVRKLPSENEYHTKLSQITTRFQTAENACKDLLNRYEIYCNDHLLFNDSYQEFKDEMDKDQDNLKFNCEIIGNLDGLQEVQKKVKELQDKQTNDNVAFEQLVAQGEGLYPHTSPDGREHLRQQLKHLKTTWNNYNEDLIGLGQKIDQCVQQFGEFNDAQEQLSNWLKEVEKSIQSHTELRSTLPEKNLQLQNHKLMHQEIISQTGLVDGVCDKAQQLIDETKDPNIKKYLDSIKDLFKNIVTKSEDLLNKLGDAVNIHKAYNTELSVLKNWINDEVEKLLPCENIQGEKSDILKKIERLEAIKAGKPTGDKQQTKLIDLFEKVTINTSPKGSETLLKELNDLKDKFDNIYIEADNFLQKQKDVHDNWKQFEDQHDELKKWCKNYESIFKELPQKNDLNEKLELLNSFKEHQDTILHKEPIVEQFFDFSNALLGKTGVEKVKIMSNQLLNRYKLLTVLSKEVVNRLQNIYNDHSQFEQKYEEADTELKKLESEIKNLTDNMDFKTLKKESIQLLNIEKDKVDSIINNLTTISEKVLPETSASGRESIRENLRSIRDRFETLVVDFKNLQKSIDTKSNQWVLYQDISQQLNKWLETMENVLGEEEKNLAISQQEIRTKILKLKSLCHEITSHNRLIETLNEKAAVVEDNQKEKDAVLSINERFLNAKDKAQNMLKNAEHIMDILNSFNEMHKGQLEHQKMLWDKLTIYSDFLGTKSELSSKLEKLNEIEKHIKTDEMKLNEIKSFVDTNSTILPHQITSNLSCDVNKMFVEYDKFKNALEKIKKDIDDRLSLWRQYQEGCDKLTQLLEETENVLKNFGLKASYEEKCESLKNYQSVFANLKEHENEFDTLSDKASELIQSCGESKTIIFVQQIKSRYLSDENAAKEVLKKCEQMVNDHKIYKDRYSQCFDEYSKAKNILGNLEDVNTVSDRTELQNYADKINSLADNTMINQLLNSVVELAENLYATTDSTGREMIRLEVQELQQKIEDLYDKIINLKTKLEFKLSNITGVESLIEKLQLWLNEIEPEISGNISYKATLDEKTQQQQKYESLLNDINSHQKEISILKNLTSNSETDGAIKQKSVKIVEQYDKYLNNAKQYSEQYEGIVHDHQQYSIAVMEAQNFTQATQNTAELWGDIDLDKASLVSNLERLKALDVSLPDEYHRVESVCEFGKKVIPNTIEESQINIQQQIDTSKQEWEHLNGTTKAIIDSINNKLDQWNDFESLRDSCMDWVRNVESNLHSIDLKSTLIEKKNQHDKLKDLQGEIRAKELEIDNVTEKSQILLRSLINSSCKNSVNELVQKYQQLSNKIKDLTARWQQYYLIHQEFDRQVSDYEGWISDLRSKINYCSDLSGNSQKEMENKLMTIQELILLKEDGSNKLQEIVEAAQNVLVNTSAPGHEPINNTVAKLHDEWSQCTMKMIDIRSSLDDSISQWSGLSDEIQNIRKSTEAIEALLDDLTEFQTTMPEKRTQLELIRNVEERVRVEKIEVDNLKAKTLEIITKGKSTPAAQLAQEVLQNFDKVFERVKKLLYEREEQFRDHRVYKEAYDNLSNYINRAREKIPMIQQTSLNDKMSIEQSVAPLESLLNKQAQGELLLEHLQSTSEVVLASTSQNGQEIIKNDIKELKQSFEDLFKEIRLEKEKLENTMVRWRDYKDELEKLSEWITQTDILVKNHKLALHPTLQDKQKQVIDMKDILNKIEKQQEEIDKFNVFASPLLKSHLDSSVGSQLRQINSRYQVLSNIAKDVMKKVEVNCNQHREFEDYYKRASNWLAQAKEVIQSCSEGNMTSKDALMSKLSHIQNLIDRREEGQNLVQNTVNNGEKTLKNTKSDGKEIINTQIKQIQSDWDRLAKKMTSAKVNLETQLLQWADYSSSYNHLQQWINDREAKLQQVTEPKAAKSRKVQPALVERKANLRQTNDIVQDIVSFEPMIQSVTSKASGLQQGAPVTEISSKYETLSKHAKELFAKQKDTVEKMQAFLDAGNEFAQWIRNAKEEINKCSETSGDKETLISKLTQLKALENDIPNGQDKLQRALEQANIAIRGASKEDRDQIEEEVGLMQGEFDNYVDVAKLSKKKLELGITKWTEFDKKQVEAFKWLNEKEGVVQSFNKLQSNLEDKRIALEKFQFLLQTLFDWQRDLDDLNIAAQTLLDICADTRISNTITQLTTKYNTILSMSKEIMKRLEIQYQEHQQHNALMQELCDDWLDRVREKLNQCKDIPYKINELQAKLNIVKGIKQSLEQGQNKLRYALELKEKVIVSTESNGVAKIEEDAENLKQDFDSLMNDVNDVRQKITSRLNLLEEISKQYKILKEWLDEARLQLPSDDKVYNEMSDKKAALEKLKNLQREAQNYSEICDKIRIKFTQENIDSSEFDEGLREFSELQNVLEKKIENLENQLSDHEKYKQSYIESYNWMKSAKKDIEEHSDPHGEKDLTLNKLESIRRIEQSMPEGKVLISNTIEVSNQLLPNCDNEGQDRIKQELRQMEIDWNELEILSKTTTENLEDCINIWNNFANKSSEIQTVLNRFKNQMTAFDNLLEIPSDDVVENTKSLSNEIESYKDVMEELNEICEILMEKSACSGVRDQTNSLNDKYNSLLSQIQGILLIINKNIVDQNEYATYKSEADKWLDNANKTIDKCNNIKNLDDINSNLNEINILLNRVTEGEKIINLMQEAFTRSSNYLPKNRQDEIMNEITSIRGEWDNIVVKIGACSNNLKAITNRWNTLIENKNRLNNWLQEKEAILQSIPKGNGEISEIKTLLERLKYLESEIAQKKNEVDDIGDEMKYFEALGAPEEDKEKLKAIVQRFETLKQNCTERITEFDMDINDHNAYQYQLQEIEKWLLQISFQLMAHNSLYISNYDQTKEQIAQHETLLDYIQKYQANIDDLDAKGQQQIKRYEPFSSSIRERIESQIKNIQDSYNSLLHTSIQIKNRLYDSLNKFKEYEETLDSIMQNLDGFEKVIDLEMEKPINTLNNAKMQLQLMQSLQDKLQQEKQRLMLAVQACEAATASISRPSSPVFNQSPAIPEKELLVRAKLDDLIDKLLPCIDVLIEKVKGFDEILTKRDDINEWIEQQTIFANDVASKPSKLRPESAAQDIQSISDVLGGINEKRNIIMTELANQLPDEEVSDLEKRLDDLETILMNQIERKRNNQQFIDDYLNSVNDGKKFFDGLIQRLEVIDGPCGMNCEQKLNELNNIKNENETKTPELKEKMQEKATKVFEVISNLDAQQVDDHSKAFQRRENDIKKRIERKIQLLDMTNKNLDKLKAEIDQTKFFFDDNIEKLSTPFVLGYLVKPIEGYIQYLKNLSKDIENKQAFIDTLNKRITNMHTELDGSEQQKMKQCVMDLHMKEKKLNELVKYENARALQGLSNAKNIENKFDIIRNWTNDQKAQNELKPLIISFAPSAIDYEVQEHRNRLQNIKDFSDGILNDTIEQVSSIKEQCGDTGKIDLQKIVDTFLDDIQTLTLTCNQQLQNIEKILQKKKEYEQDSDGLLNWIKEINHILSTNVKTSSIQILEEQKHKYEGLLKECESKEYLLKAIQDKADSLMENLSEVDRLNLTCQVKNLTDKLNLLILKLKERYNGIVDNIKQLKESQKQIAEYTQFILSIQQSIKELNKPIGSKTEDVVNLLKDYENILNRLKAKKAEMSMQKISSLPQIKELLSTHDDIIEAIENQLRRLKQLLMLREQFIALVNEIVNFNVKYTDIVAHIEKSDDKIENKIKQYDKIMHKIHECEGLLLSANDKGMQIASEGTVEDRNNIIEQLQALKNHLQTLKQTVENLRQQHEKAANLYKNFESDLNKTINVLHEKEVAVKILPVLDIDTETVEQEIRKHETLAADIKKMLVKLQTILDGIDNERTLPPSLVDTVSIGKSLLKSLPEAINDRKNYLESNKDYRLKYTQNVGDFNNWINSVESDFMYENDDIDLENISSMIDKHVSFVDNKLPEIKLLLEKINDCAKHIMPSLNNISKEELLRDLQKYISTFKDSAARAEKSKQNLQNSNDLWREYCTLLQSVDNILTKVPKESSINSISKLQDFLQKLNDKLRAIQAQQEQIDKLNQLFEKLLHIADQSNREKIQRQNTDINLKWTNTINSIDNQIETLSQIAQNWLDLERDIAAVEKSLLNITEKVKEIDFGQKSQSQLEEVKNNILQYIDDTKILEKHKQNLKKLAKPVLEFLKEEQPEVVDPIKNKLETISEQIFSLSNTLNGKYIQVKKILELLKDLSQNCAQIDTELQKIEHQLAELDPYAKDIDQNQHIVEQIHNKLSNYRNEIKKIANSLDEFEEYISPEIIKHLKDLELKVEGLLDKMEEYNRAFKMAKTIRSEYLYNIEKVHGWIMDTEQKLNSHYTEPLEYKVSIHNSCQERPSVTEWYDTANKNGQSIIELTQDESEAFNIRQHLDFIRERLGQIFTLLDDQKTIIDNVVDAWSKFMELYQIIINWATEKKIFVNQELKINNQQEAQTKLSEYTTSLTSIKSITQNLSDMNKFLDDISEYKIVDRLKEKLHESENLKLEIESILIKRNALLLELTEEWDQYEKKIKDVYNWIKKSRATFESPQYRNRPLRDQLVYLEKTLADITTQKTKITISYEKLQVHFRTELSCEKDLNDEYTAVIQNLDQLHQDVSRQIGDLEKALQQIDKYQHDIQMLKQKLVQEEQLLKTMTPEHGDATDTIQSSRERIKNIQENIKMRNDHIKTIIKRGTPDVDFLKI